MCWCVLVCVGVCGGLLCGVVCVVWCVVWCGPLKTSVRRFTMPPCVTAKRPCHTRHGRFESTHGDVLNLHTHQHTRTPPTVEHKCLSSPPNHLHESLPLARKPPTWAKSPILLFQRQCLHHKRMHLRLNTNTHIHHTHIDTNAKCTRHIHTKHEHAHTHNTSANNGTMLIAVTSDEEHEGT